MALCGEVVQVGVNNNAFHLALEAALSKRHVDLAWSLLEGMREREIPIKEHYFWPLFHPKQDCQDIVGE